VRLAVPSYLAPGTWLENLKIAADLGWIRGVELLFFSYDEEARRIMAKESAGIAAMSSRFEFSLHFPDPLENADEALVELTRPYVPLYIVHPPAEASEPELTRWAALLGSWRARYGEVFALEYTGRVAFARAERASPGLPLCPDVGRLVLDGEDPATWIGGRADRVAELQLHAARGDVDHFPLSGEEPWLLPILELALSRDWRVELEVFSLEGAAASARALERARRRPRC
jgi:sugar phosphate isomerase/epimerase